MELPPLPEVHFLGDDVSYGYDAEDMRAYATAAIAAAVAEEREACAKLCESRYPEWNPDSALFTKPCFDSPEECADAIRARSTLTP